MSIGLIHLGASVRGLAFAMAREGRVDEDRVLAAAAANRFGAGALRSVQPTSDAGKAREQVMAERGVDRITLMQLSPKDQVAAEASIAAATALRTGSLVDLKV